MSKILVTGASGFIGSNLVETLLRNGHTVIGMDNDPDKQYLLNDVIPKKERKSEIELRIDEMDYISKEFTMIWDDINNIRRYYYAMDDIDEIYHLAASADVRKSFEDPTMDLKNNVQGTNEILELMRLKDIKKLIFSSSSSIYGVAKITPTPEDASDMRPISMYGASKLANEAFINAYGDLYGIKAWMFRFANVVGKHIKAS
jgi:UDP-glucose 4-epimerase